MTQRDLAARLGTSEAAVSRMVAGLARDGYVDVARGTGNRRSLSLTPHGGRALDRRGGRPRRRLRPARAVAPAPTRAPSRPPCAPSWPPSSSSPPAPSPRRSDVHAWTLLIVTHVVGALTSVVLGGYQVWRRPKGDTRHRLLGRVWVVLILWTAISSFWIRHINEGAFSWLHVLSVVTLVTVTLGVVNAVRGNVPAHRGNMVGSWLGRVRRDGRGHRRPRPDDPHVCRRPAERCPRLPGLGARRHRARSWPPAPGWPSSSTAAPGAAGRPSAGGGSASAPEARAGARGRADVCRKIVEGSASTGSRPAEEGVSDHLPERTPPMRRILPVAAVLALALTTAACGSDDADTAASSAPIATSTPPPPPVALTDRVDGHGRHRRHRRRGRDFTTLAAALEAAGLAETLKGAGPVHGLRADRRRLRQAARPARSTRCSRTPRRPRPDPDLPRGAREGDGGGRGRARRPEGQTVQGGELTVASTATRSP